VRLLNAIGAVDYISFGSESGDIHKLSEVAALLASEKQSPFQYGGAPISEAIRAASAEGLSYPAARERAVAILLGEEAAALLKEPNNILGIEYLKQLMQMESPIKALTIPRYAASVNAANEESGIAGATAIRRMIADGELSRAASFMPPVAAELLFNGKGAVPRILDGALFSMLCRAVSEAEAEAPSQTAAEAKTRTADAAYGGTRLSEILSATEGLENRLATAVRSAKDIDSAVRQIKTKRYTETRVRRLILHTVFGLTKEKMAIAAAEAPYARVLAMNGRGARLITKFRRVADMSFITNANRSQEDLARAPVTFAYDIKAAETWKIMATGSLKGFVERSAPPLKISGDD
jgi:predicted nucleotidyltransferase